MPNSPRLSDRTRATVPPLLAMAGIFALSSVPGSLPADVSGAYRVFLWVPPDVQNLLHVPVFGLLAALWQQAARRWRLRPGPSAALALGLTLAYAAFDEWYQLHVPGRYANLTDLSLDALGAVLGVGLMLLWQRRTP